MRVRRARLVDEARELELGVVAGEHRIDGSRGADQHSPEASEGEVAILCDG